MKPGLVSVGGDASAFEMKNESGCYACFNGVHFVTRDRLTGMWRSSMNPSCKENRVDRLTFDPKQDVMQVEPCSNQSCPSKS